ncbi:MAG: NADH-quinone oxidoreductase subunit L [Gemmataceae bacterium]
MSDQWILWLIPGAPLLAAVLAGMVCPFVNRAKSHRPVILGLVVSCAVALWATFTLVTNHDIDRISAAPITWFQAGDLVVQYGLTIDPLTAVMLSAITFIGTWIAVFSVGYAHGEPGYPRYFAVLSLFVTMMCVLVMADNLILLYAGWEGVGLCSYLLIGFWFHKPSAAAAARKAFLVTRIGDAGLILGIFLLWHQGAHSMRFDDLFEQANTFDPDILNAACLLLFCGAVGKSAQFPLHVWLPDAMEGPTPASALIHAATMVTAGVYLVARCLPLYYVAPTAQHWIAITSIVTAMLAALIALTQHDLKRVMAYSTISQLGMMFLGLGSARYELAVAGATAAIFHLFTHAFFKALLFLASGSVMHAMGHVIDMRRFSGLRKVMPVTHATFACGAAALAGLVPFAGFWSKDEILHTALEVGHVSDRYGSLYTILGYLAMITAGLTAFYTFRAYFRTFWGDLVVPPEAGSHGHDHSHDAHHDSHTPGHADHAHGHHRNIHAHPVQGDAHESPSVMTLPLIVLAVGAATVGAALGPTHLIGHFLARTPAYRTYLPAVPDESLNWTMMGLSTAVAVAGVTVAYLMYGRQRIPAPKSGPGLALYKASQNRFYIDEAYDLLVVKPAAGLAKVSAFFDTLVDGLVDFVGDVPGGLGRMLRPIQNGLVQFYALAMVLGLTVFIGILTLRSLLGKS